MLKEGTLCQNHFSQSWLPSVQSAFSVYFLGASSGSPPMTGSLSFMSLLIGICSILRALSFYHLIHTHAYLSLDVSCTKREQTLFGKNQQYWFASDNGKEYAFSLEKNIKLLEGHRYRLYFRKPQQGTGQSMPCAGDILGYEELTDQLPELPDTSV